jgi:glycosyltransferase involved in cell wall biosynthesis
MDRVVAMTQTIADCYRDLDVPESKIVEIPNGVEIDRFAAPSDGPATRRRWGLPLDAPLLLTVGRYHPKKGYATIPKIARVLKERGVPFFWQVIGGNTDRIAPLIEQAGVGDVVGTADEIGVSAEDNGIPVIPDKKLVEMYQCADIFVFPSRLEGFPRVLIEAMAAGMAVVTTDAPGCMEVVQDGVTALVSDPDDVEGMASHIQTLIEDESLRKRLVANGLRHAKQFDWDTIIDSYERLYESVLT